MFFIERHINSCLCPFIIALVGKMATQQAAPRYVPSQTRSRPLEVLALGLPRTGTRSVTIALSNLGLGHCAHGFDLMDDMPYTARWEQAVDAKYLGKGKPFEREDWDELLGHCSAVADMPCAIFWRELCAAYPDAKVVLVQRDENKWYNSFAGVVIDSMFTPSSRLNRALVEPLLGSKVGAVCLKLLQGWLESDDAEGMKARARSAYRRHYDEVKASVAKERLLEYRLGSGWKPLCDFLGKEVPDEPFPWVNEVDALQVKIEEFKAQKRDELKAAMLAKGLPALACGVVVAVTAHLIRR